MAKVVQKSLEKEVGGGWGACEKSGIKWDRNQAHQLCQLSGDPEVKKTPRD